MHTQTVVTHDDIRRHFEGAAAGIADLLPDNPAGRSARLLAIDLAMAARRSLDDAGVPRETA